MLVSEDDAIRPPANKAYQVLYAAVGKCIVITMNQEEFLTLDLADIKRSINRIVDNYIVAV